MILSWLFKKYKERNYRIILIKEIIENLNIDENQKKLYSDSIEVLDMDWLDRFYEKLTSVIEILEDDENRTISKTRSFEFDNISKKENLDKIQEINSFNLILDNI